MGYTVVKLECLSDSSAGRFAAMFEESVYYPMVDGEFQAITQEYVAQKLSELKEPG